MDLSEVRRLNALVIMRENALDEVSFALCLGKDEDQITAMLAKGTSKKISDGLARTMEQTFSKPMLWLDQGQGRTLGDESGAQGPSYDLFG